MKINIKNQHLYYAVETAWSAFNYKMKFTINALIASNDDSEYVQTIDISEADFALLFRAAANQPEGIASNINHDIMNSLFPQLYEASNMNEVTMNEAPPNEASRILIAVDTFNKENQAALEAKIINGKSQILYY